jgi:hypothetical protein
MAIVTPSGISKATGKIAPINKALVFKPGDAYAPEGSLGKTAGSNPAPAPTQGTIIKPLVALTGNANISPYRMPTATTTGRVFDNNPVQRTLPTQPANTPIVRLTSGAYTEPVYKNAETIIRNQQPSNNFIGPSPDVQIQQAQGWALDDIRFQQATFSAQNFGTLPDNIPTWWADDWQFTPAQMSQMGYTLLGSNLWTRGGAGGGVSGNTGGGYSVNAGGGFSGNTGVSNSSVTGRVGYTNSSGYSSDQVFNWRLASG